MDHPKQQHHPTPNSTYLIALARAMGGAIIFSLPIFMTMEMWHLGVTTDRLRLALLLTLLAPILVGISHLCGFEKTFGWVDDVVDAAAAITIAFLSAIIILWLFGEIQKNLNWDDLLGKIAIQTIPGSIGALLAQSEFGNSRPNKKEISAHHLEFLLMLAGALFLALSVAPTEEILIIAMQITPWQTLALLTISLITMHAFVYAVDFRGTEPRTEGLHFGSLFFRYTIPGYALALLTSTFLLWTFGRTTGLDSSSLLTSIIVLGFPAAIGAAAARLIL